MSCHIPACFCPLPPRLLTGSLIPDEAITGLQLNPSNVKFSATISTGSLRLADRSPSTEGKRLNTLKLYLIPLNPFVRIISEVYLRDIWFLYSLPHRFCSISVWSLLNLDMFRQLPTEALNCISYHQQAQMTSDIAGASWAYTRRNTVCVVCFKISIWGENQRLNICDLLELKWRLKRRQRAARLLTSWISTTGSSPCQQMIAFPAWSFCATLLAKKRLCRNVFFKVTRRAILSCFPDASYLVICVLVCHGKNAQLKLKLLITSARMCAHSVLSN